MLTPVQYWFLKNSNNTQNQWLSGKSCSSVSGQTDIGCDGTCALNYFKTLFFSIWIVFLGWSLLLPLPPSLKWMVQYYLKPVWFILGDDIFTLPHIEKWHFASVVPIHCFWTEIPIHHMLPRQCDPAVINYATRVPNYAKPPLDRVSYDRRRRIVWVHSVLI